MENKDKHLTDYFSPHELQAMQDAFSRVIRLPVVVVDEEGIPLSRPRNVGFFCRLKTDGCTCAGCPACLPHPRAGDPAFGVCPRTGLSVVGIPICVEGVCLGGWALGQLRLTKPAGKTLKNIAKTNAIPLEDAKSALVAIPKMGWEELGPTLDFLRAAHAQIPKLAQMAPPPDKSTKGLQKLAAMLTQPAAGAQK